MQVPVIKMPIVKYAGQPPCTDKGIIDLQEPSLYHENSLIEFFLNYDKVLDINSVLFSIIFTLNKDMEGYIYPLENL